MNADPLSCLEALPLPLFRDVGERLEAVNAAAREVEERLAGCGLERPELERAWREAGRSFAGGGARWLLLSPAPERQRLLEQHGAMGRFAGGLTHNLNNPLNALSGMVQLMMFRMPELTDLGKVDAQSDELAKMIRRVGDRFRRLADWPEGMPLSWQEVLREELVFFRSNMALKHRCVLDARLEGESPCPLPYVDGAWLFGRLLESALDFVPADGQLPLRVELQDGWPRIVLEGARAERPAAALAPLLDGRVAVLLAAHGRRLAWGLEGERLELSCPAL